MHTLGWIGIGAMGELMALNLLQAGNKLNVYNRSIEKTVSLVEAGAKQLHTPKDIVEKSDITFLMLSNTQAVHDVLVQEDGILEGLAPGKVIVDMSTISPQDSIAFSQMVAEKGGIYLEAPVSGSIGPARSGQLVILVGGDEKTKKLCQPYFDVLGKATIYFGTNGSGSSAKLAINLLLGIVGQGVAETMVFAEKAGLDRDSLLELISLSAMNTPLFQGKKDMYRNQEFPSAFMLKLMSKDLGLVKSETERLEMSLPLANATNKTYLSAKENGKGDMDMAAVYLELKENNRY